MLVTTPSTTKNAGDHASPSSFFSNARETGGTHPLHGFEFSPAGDRRQRFQPPLTSAPAPPSPPSSSAVERGTRGLCSSSPPCRPPRLGPQPSRDHAPPLRALNHRRPGRRPGFLLPYSSMCFRAMNHMVRKKVECENGGGSGSV
ncbi:hypothetical protein DEO72_LG2g3159 [Vigna unguiculata]|uniref:Uncharacterized protein n=1 Tax=Vigna unguiculata TaxID=3917 RepID=A0A4D6L2W3_VIGUN|nr:hypothetical protein DEO72_LG2g3159 [Vigna unguiculata]